MHCLDFNSIAQNYNLNIKNYSNSVLMAVGTQEGQVLLYQIGHGIQNALFKTQGGVAFGQITSVSLFENHSSFRMIVGTQSAEMIAYDLFEEIATMAQ